MTQRSSSAARSLTIHPGPSRLLALYLLVTHVAASLVVLLVDWPHWVETALLASIALSLIHCLSSHVYRVWANAVQSALWDADGLWWLRNGSDQRVRAKLLPDSYVTLNLVILNFKTGRRRRSLILTRDSVDKETLRILRVRLRLEYQQTLHQEA